MGGEGDSMALVVWEGGRRSSRSALLTLDVARGCDAGAHVDVGSRVRSAAQGRQRTHLVTKPVSTSSLSSSSLILEFGPIIPTLLV